MQRLFLMLVLALFLTGCAHSINTTSYLAPELPQAGLSRAADDLTVFLVTTYPPGQTTLNLAPVNSGFNELLENKLRSKGFEIVAPASQKGTRLVYIIDTLEDGKSFYIKATLSDGQVFSKVYFINDGGLLKGAATHGQKVDASDFQKTIR